MNIDPNLVRACAEKAGFVISDEAIGVALSYLIPFVWQIIKPLIHAATGAG